MIDSMKFSSLFFKGIKGKDGDPGQKGQRGYPVSIDIDI